MPKFYTTEIGLIITLSIFACKNQRQSVSPTEAPISNDCSIQENNDPACKTDQGLQEDFLSSGGPDFQTEAENHVPNFNSTATIGGRFNQKALDKLEIPEKYKGKMIFAKQTAFHRPLWLDLRKNTWAGFDNFSNRFGKTVRSISPRKSYSDWILGIFKAPPSVRVKDFSIHQPIPSPSFLPDLDMTVTFYVTGHAAVDELKSPKEPTLVLAPSPLIIQPNRQNPTEANIAFIYPIGKPKDYELVYEKNGPYLSDEIDECIKFNKKLSTSGGVPDQALLTKCSFLFESVEAATAGSKTDGTFNNALDDLYQKQSAALWKPIPNPGYQCLGFVASNGRNDKPILDSDFNQSITVSNNSLTAATSCVEEKYLVPGKLDPKPLVSDGEVTIFRITNDSENFPEGYAEGNYFYAFSGFPDTKALSEVKVWVLSEKHTAFISEP